ncbi:sensor histidine kinase [Clostridium chromiireducens]|uniref:histidine kinase n=1 Tax=Clostridium chromiireducens TaxID=225345 RepID=A0A399IP94_9CLOT|nr:HAMP domain-containing sensor histidine kinase [Clostridium chromiireducens]RII34835.1 sensor histidine kinase [Clostridium chromiireducens]
MLSRLINYLKKTIRNPKISIKLTIVYALMFSVALLILNTSILFGVKYYLYKDANKQIEDVKVRILKKVKSQRDKVDLSDKELISDVPSEENVSIRILQEDGKMLNISNEFDYDIKVEEPYDTIEYLEVEDTKDDYAEDGEDDEEHLAMKNVKIKKRGHVIAYLQIVKNMDNEEEFLRILFWIMSIADFIGIIISLILGYMVSKKMLKPIQYINNTAENISINNLKERINVNDSGDELNKLANTFNNMIDRLQESFTKQALFVSHASHELRTPIAVIQGYANLLDRWGKDDREALEKSIYAIKLEAANMGDLVEKLLFLARGDRGVQIMEKKEFYLNELVEEVVSDSRLINPNRIITCNKKAEIIIAADYKMLKQMLRIFVDNSIKFSDEQDKIDISSEAQDKFLKLTVSDNGIGIPEGEIENIFDRFYIIDKSRSKEKAGTGLGLPIAKYIIDLHKGSIDIESEEGKGTKIVVTLNYI